MWGGCKTWLNEKFKTAQKNGVYAPDTNDRVILRVDSTTLILQKREKVESKGAEVVVEEWKASIERGKKYIIKNNMEQKIE